MPLLVKHVERTTIKNCNNHLQKLTKINEKEDEYDRS